MRSAGIQRSGGKFFMASKLVKLTPYYKVLISLFCGASWFELQCEPALVFEQWNDIDSNLMNYYEIITEYTNQFEEYKDGFFGLVYDKTLNRFKNLLDDGLAYEQILALPIKKRIERAYAFYYISKLISGMNKIGIPEFNRPRTNQDRGVLTHLDEASLDRMRYVHFTSLDFEKCYNKFKKHYDSNAYDIKEKEVLIFCDKPYIEQKIYDFPEEEHIRLAELLKNTSFRFMLTCRNSDFNKDMFNEKGFYFTDINTRYPLNVHSQNNKGVKELLITNFDPKQIGKTINPMLPANQEPLDKWFSK